MEPLDSDWWENSIELPVEALDLEIFSFTIKLRLELSKSNTVFARFESPCKLSELLTRLFRSCDGIVVNNVNFPSSKNY